jgi:hypothetical protein
LPPPNQGQPPLVGAQQPGGPPPQGQVDYNIPNNPPQAQVFYQALIRLGLSPVGAQEFINNGITSLNKLRTLSVEALDMFIKQITKQSDAQALNPGVGIFHPFFSQQYIREIRFWANRMYILGMQFEVNQVTEHLAEIWNETMKREQEAAKVSAFQARSGGFTACIYHQRI